MKSLLVMLLPLIIGGCAVSKAPFQMDLDAKALVPPNGKALIYVLRPGIFGCAARGTVNCDNYYLGSLAGSRFIYSIQEPGKHILTGIVQNKNSIEIDLKAGKVYYIEQLISNVYGNNRMTLLEDSAGKKKLRNCRLSDPNL